MKANNSYITLTILLYSMFMFAYPNSVQASNVGINEPYDTLPASVFPPISTFENVDSSKMVVVYIGGEHKEYGNIYSRLSFVNDVKYFYHVIRHGYHIPKDNINVLFGTGVDGSMEILTNDGPEPLSLDLDNDSINDIIGGITVNRVDDLFDSLAWCIQPDQHLLLVFDLHGEPNNNFDGYMHLLDGHLRIESLATKLNSIKCASQCIILNSCFSGTFIRTLQKNGRIILTSADNTKSYGFPEKYNFFIHRWTNAINGICSMTYGNADKDEDGHISLLESFNYAHALNIGYTEYYDQTEQTDPPAPQYCSMPAELGDNWAINHQPKLSGDLHIRDNEDDWGQTMADDNNRISWQSPDIWVRNNNDGLVNPQNEALRLSATDSTVYVYVRVNNNGYNYYDGNGRYLHLHWKLPSLRTQHLSWLEHEEIIPITCSIDTLSSEILCYELRLPTEVKNIAIADNGNLNLNFLARINDEGAVAGTEYDTQFPFEESKHIDVANNPKLAGLCIVPNTSVNGTATLHTSVRLNTGESALAFRALTGIPHDFAVTYSINNTTYTQTQNESADVVISGLQSNVEYPLTITCSAVVPRLLAKRTVLLPIGLACNDSILGGVTFQMSIKGTGGLDPGIGDSGETGDFGGFEDGGEIGGPIFGGRTLSMTNVDEPVTCEWSDSQGTVLGHNEKLAIPLNAKGVYTLSVQALDDNISASVTKRIEPISYFKSIATSNSEIVVELRSVAPAGTKLSLRPITNETSQNIYNVPEGTTTKAISMSNLPAGIYLLSISVNDQLLETTKISL